MTPIEYIVRGVIIWGGSDTEKVQLVREVKPGDVFFANSRWYLVKRAGLQENKYSKGDYVLEAEVME